MSSEADLLTRYLEIINHREQDAWSEVLSTDHTWNGVLQGVTSTGIAAFQDVLAGYLQAFPDLRIEVQHIFGGEGFAAARVTHRGTHLAQGWAGRQATGNRMELLMHLHARIADGKIAEVWEIWDRVAVRDQLDAG